jgi:hypothetical protein
VFWNAPRDQRWDGEQKKYNVCYSFDEKSSNPLCHGLTSSNSLNLDGLNSATKYFVTVSTVTYDGRRWLTGPQSVEISQITNGGKYELK